MIQGFSVTDAKCYACIHVDACFDLIARGSSALLLCDKASWPCIWMRWLVTDKIHSCRGMLLGRKMCTEREHPRHPRACTKATMTMTCIIVTHNACHDYAAGSHICNAASANASSDLLQQPCKQTDHNVLTELLSVM